VVKALLTVLHKNGKLDGVKYRMMDMITIKLFDRKTKFNADQQCDFISSPQTGANCGHMAVWHALKIHKIAAEEDPAKFVKRQKIYFE
jgi:hypothetical protein